MRTEVSKLSLPGSVDADRLVDVWLMRMAVPEPPRSAFAVEMVRVIGLLEPKEVSMRGEDLSPSPSLDKKKGGKWKITKEV